MAQSLQKTDWQFHVELKVYLLYDSTILHRDLLKRNEKICAEMKNCTNVHSHFIYNNQNEKIQVSNIWLDDKLEKKGNSRTFFQRIMHSNSKELFMDAHNTMDEY